MEILNKLTPTESYLLKENSSSSFKDLLKYTLIDLLLKRVLQSDDIEHQSHPSNPVRINKYVSAGPNFKNYQAKPHELVYLEPFLKNQELQMLFRHVVKMGYENASSMKRFVFNKLIKSKDLETSFEQGVLNRLFGKIKLTRDGVIKQSQVVKELNKLDEQLPELIENRPQEALNILKQIYGNVFLLNNVNFEALKQIDDELTKEMSRRGTENTSGCTACTGCYMYYDSYSDSFDSEYDAVDSSNSGWGGDSGCSTDSGCSGCGGCGGCS